MKILLISLFLISMAHAGVVVSEGASPAGTTISFAGVNCPTGYLRADGSAVSRTTYAKLFSAISTNYGAGDGSTTFNLPNQTEGGSKLHGSIKYGANLNCSWTSTSTTLANLSADTDCQVPTVTGLATAPSTKIPAIVFSTMPAGVYYVVATSKFVFNTTTISAEAYARFSDGTNTSSIQFASAAFMGGVNNATNSNSLIGRFEYASTQSNVTINIQVKTNNASNAVNLSTVDGDFEIQVWFFPTKKMCIKY